MANNNYRAKVLSKINYSKGFNPTFFGGLRGITNNEIKTPNSKTKNLNMVKKRISMVKTDSKDPFSEFANDRSIQDITIEMMDQLESEVNQTVNDYMKTLQRDE